MIDGLSCMVLGIHYLRILKVVFYYLGPLCIAHSHLCATEANLMFAMRVASSVELLVDMKCFLVESHAMLGRPLMLQLHVEHGGVMVPCTHVA